MAAITKTWTSIADTAVDPDSPLNTSLLTALRDNAIVVREWLGASFIAGAVQDHDHDGVNSALLEVGANIARNGGFESGEAGWTFTDYSGGSHAIATSAHRDGAKSVAFTSTVLANGGGDCISAAHVPVPEGESLGWRCWVWASVANVSAKVQAVWYDNTKAQISATDLYSTTNAPTSATQQSGTVVVPASGRYVRLKLIGGVPATGAATGTVRFDAAFLWRPGVLDGTGIGAAAVAQGHLKTTTGTVSTTSGTFVDLTLPGGSYGFYPQIRTDQVGDDIEAQIAGNLNQSTSFETLIAMRRVAGSGNEIAQQRYVQASPPYDLGDGAIPLFIFAALDAGGQMLHGYCAPDPPWANNGPTTTRADYYRGDRAYRLQRQVALSKDMLRGAPQERATYLAALRTAPLVEIEITQQIKQADMPLIPHAFGHALDGVASVVLLDTRRCPELADMHADGEGLLELLARDYLRLDSKPLATPTPPGVVMVEPKWRDT